MSGRKKGGGNGQKEPANLDQLVEEVANVVGAAVSVDVIKKELAANNYHADTTAARVLDNKMKTAEAWEEVKTKRKEKPLTKEEGGKPSWGDMAAAADASQRKKQSNKPKNGQAKADSGSGNNAPVSGTTNNNRDKRTARNNAPANNNTGQNRDGGRGGARAQAGAGAAAGGGSGRGARPRSGDDQSRGTSSLQQGAQPAQTQHAPPAKGPAKNAWMDGGKSNLIKMPPGSAVQNTPVLQAPPQLQQAQPAAGQQFQQQRNVNSNSVVENKSVGGGNTRSDGSRGKDKTGGKGEVAGSNSNVSKPASDVASSSGVNVGGGVGGGKVVSNVVSAGAVQLEFPASSSSSSSSSAGNVGGGSESGGISKGVSGASSVGQNDGSKAQQSRPQLQQAEHQAQQRGGGGGVVFLPHMEGGGGGVMDQDFFRLAPSGSGRRNNKPVQQEKKEEQQQAQQAQHLLSQHQDNGHGGGNAVNNPTELNLNMAMNNLSLNGNNNGGSNNNNNNSGNSGNKNINQNNNNQNNNQNNQNSNQNNNGNNVVSNNDNGGNNSNNSHSNMGGNVAANAHVNQLPDAHQQMQQLEALAAHAHANGMPLAPHLPPMQSYIPFGLMPPQSYPGLVPPGFSPEGQYYQQAHAPTGQSQQQQGDMVQQQAVQGGYPLMGQYPYPSHYYQYQFAPPQLQFYSQLPQGGNQKKYVVPAPAFYSQQYQAGGGEQQAVQANQQPQQVPFIPQFDYRFLQQQQQLHQQQHHGNEVNNGGGGAPGFLSSMAPPSSANSGADPKKTPHIQQQAQSFYPFAASSGFNYQQQHQMYPQHYGPPQGGNNAE